MLRVYEKAKQIADIRSQFPSLNYAKIHYLDNAATSQTVDTAIKAVSDYHYNYRSNIHRGEYASAMTASNLYEEAREQVAKLINAKPFEIAFTSGTTDGLNRIAESIDKDRKVIITELEHHSNIMPWIKTGRTQNQGDLIVVQASDHGDVSLEDFYTALEYAKPGTFVSITTQSNLTGLELKWRDMVQIAKEQGCEVMLDACQTIGHKPIDVQTSNMDWMVFSGHKMFASTGIGVIFKRGGFHDVELSVGGGTVQWLNFDKYDLNSDPSRIEAGTPNIAGVHSIGAAAQWIQDTTYKTIAECEKEFYNMLKEKGLFDIKDMKLIGPKTFRSVYSFVLKDHDASDVATLLGMQDVCVRSGHLCAYPASCRYNPTESGVLRVSLAPYNDENDCVQLVEGLWKIFEKLNS